MRPGRVEKGQVSPKYDSNSEAQGFESALIKNNGWDRLQKRLLRADFDAGRLLVGLDFDGTLAEIVETPKKAALTKKTRRLLLALCRRPDTKVAILSGRALGDVRSLVGLPGVYYAGNHGLEIQGPGIRWRHPQVQPIASSIICGLEADLGDFPGAVVEYKRLGLAVHYRRVPRGRLSQLTERLREKLSPLRGRFRFLFGKMTFDVRSTVSWDKGHALETIRRILPGGWMAVFVGDDITDEEAFQTIGPKALTVRVGRVRRSSAQYVVAHRRFVDRLLHAFARRRGNVEFPE